MRTLIVLIALLVCVSSEGVAKQKQQKPKGPLYGLALVLDPGHGGVDPGAVTTSYSNGRWLNICEASYMYDIALRVKRLADRHQAAVLLTRHNPAWKEPVDSPPPELACRNDSDTYTVGGATPGTRPAGLSPRLAAAQAWQVKYGKNHKVVFLSIHFDSTPDKGIMGTHVIASQDDSKLGRSLVNAFKKRGLQRSHSGAPFLPLVVNGDKNHGVRRLYVLSERNPIKERALVELGSLSSERDVARLRSPKAREEYAQAIVEALVAFKK